MPTDAKSLENPPDVEVPKGDYIEADVEAALKNQELRRDLEMQGDGRGF